MEDFLTITIRGSSLDQLRANFKKFCEEALGLTVVDAKPKSNGHAAGEEIEEEAAPAPAPTIGTRRGRKAEAREKELTVSEMRDQAVDILKKCYGIKPDGAERVIALQNKLKVKRFAELGDDKIKSLLTAAQELEAALTGAKNTTAAAAPDTSADTGPF